MMARRPGRSTDPLTLTWRSSVIRTLASFVVVAACLPQLAAAGGTPSIGIAKQVTSLVDQGGGINDVTFSFSNHDAKPEL